MSAKPDYEYLYNDMKDQRDHALARIADLEAQLAVMQWRPVSDPPAEKGTYETLSNPPRSLVIYGHATYYPGQGWGHAAADREPDYWRPLMPPPPGG